MATRPPLYSRRMLRKTDTDRAFAAMLARVKLTDCGGATLILSKLSKPLVSQFDL